MSIQNGEALKQRLHKVTLAIEPTVTLQVSELQDWLHVVNHMIDEDDVDETDVNDLEYQIENLEEEVENLTAERAELTKEIEKLEQEVATYKSSLGLSL